MKRHAEGFLAALAAVSIGCPSSSGGAAPAASSSATSVSVAGSAKSQSGGNGGSCFQIIPGDKAGQQTCTMQTAVAPAHIVCNQPGTAAGSCPSSNLDGCCVNRVKASGPGAPTNLFSTCFYGGIAKESQAQKMLCPNATWQTTVPQP
jgi:hypothetical protein